MGFPSHSFNDSLFQHQSPTFVHQSDKGQLLGMTGSRNLHTKLRSHNKKLMAEWDL